MDSHAAEDNRSISPPEAEPLLERRYLAIAILAATAIAIHLLLRWILPGSGDSTGVGELPRAANWPLWIALGVGGTPIVLELLWKAWRREFGSDLLAGISIVASAILEEYLAGTLVVLMLSGGQAIERYAVSSASSVLRALARRVPSRAHKLIDGEFRDIPLAEVAPGDELTIFPHEICPVDGVVLRGHGSMDESFLTGEPYDMSKAPGSTVISGAMNGEAALTIRAARRAIDSRYAQIMKVVRGAEEHRPRIRRLGDQLGALYTPIALTIAIGSWVASGEPLRFLAVLVVATPCPLLIAIPVAVIGAISLAARRGIIIRKTNVLEQASECRTIIFDKTGTLTYGRPLLASLHVPEPFERRRVLQLAASLERYSKHPLAAAILDQAKEEGIDLLQAEEASEPPGQGLIGKVDGSSVRIAHRKMFLAEHPEQASELPELTGGMECLVLIEGRLAGVCQFRDQPRSDGLSFIRHLRPKHQFGRVMILSGDREKEVRRLADLVGIEEVYAEKTPEEKLAIVAEETKRAKTLFIGDGINDAPALAIATVGLAFGQANDIAGESAGAVIMDSSLSRVDEFFHISQRMRTIALQSALGGMFLSIAGMFLAATGRLPPTAGALLQEAIDVAAVLNAVRTAWPPRRMTDF